MKALSLTIVSLCALLVLSVVVPCTAEDRREHDTATLCETALAPMRDTMATLKQGSPLTPDQETVWRDWNRHCRHASWQQALAEGLPPARTEYPPNPTGAQLWLATVGRAIQNVDPSRYGPMTHCRTTYAQKGSRAGYYTTCTTH